MPASTNTLYSWSNDPLWSATVCRPHGTFSIVYRPFASDVVSRWIGLPAQSNASIATVTSGTGVAPSGAHVRPTRVPYAHSWHPPTTSAPGAIPSAGPTASVPEASAGVSAIASRSASAPASAASPSPGIATSPPTAISPPVSPDAAEPLQDRVRIGLRDSVRDRDRGRDR